MEKIAALVNDRKIDGIADLRDESDRKGIRVVIDLKRGVIPDIVVNALYKFTPLETSFGINMLAVLDNRPALLNLKTALSCFVDHRREVVIRRTRYDLEKAEARAHILEGLRIAIDHIDEVVALIRASANPDEARQGLMATFELSEIQPGPFWTCACNVSPVCSARNCWPSTRIFCRKLNSTSPCWTMRKCCATR